MVSAFAATTRNEDFIKMEGLMRLVNSSCYRKEVVAGGLSEYLTAGTWNTFKDSRAFLIH
jgi:hypothetical protein